MGVDRTQLIDALRGPRVSARRAFVLLWTWLEGRGATDADEWLMAEGIATPHRHPVPVRVPAGRPVTALVDWLDDAQTDGELDGRAALCLGHLSTVINQRPLRPERGVDGEEHVVVETRYWLVREVVASGAGKSARSRTTALPGWRGSQSGNVRRYAPNWLVVRARPRNDTEVRHLPVEAWCGRSSAKDRLQRCREERRLRVLLYPFGLPLDMAADVRWETEAGAVTHADDPERRWAHVECAGSESTCLGELGVAVDAAVEQATDVLVFPELSFTPSMLQRLCAHLAAAQGRAPALTIAGLAHVAAPGGSPLSVNEAVVLDGRGRELHRHRKRSPVGPEPFGERIELGREIAVLQSPIGGLVAPICYDILKSEDRPVLNGSGAEIVLVPSLSPQTTAHEQAARIAAVDGLASTFVCNRWFASDGDWTPARGSFLLVPGAPPAPSPDGAGPDGDAVERPGWRAQAEGEALIFDLRALFDLRQMIE